MDLKMSGLRAEPVGISGHMRRKTDRCGAGKWRPSSLASSKSLGTAVA
jgi:hypothetical protein